MRDNHDPDLAIYLKEIERTKKRIKRLHGVADQIVRVGYALEQKSVSVDEILGELDRIERALGIEKKEKEKEKEKVHEDRVR